MNELTPLSIAKKESSSPRIRKWRRKLRFIRLLKSTLLGGVLRRLLLQLPHIQAIVRLNTIGYLAQTGWAKTDIETGCKYAIDKDGQPIPWYSYSIIHFLNERLRPGMTLFEYGCGQSTLYYEKKELIIDAIDEDPKWAKRIQKATGKNVRIHYVKGTAQYNIFVHSLKRKFHIIVVDGHPVEERPVCVKEALQSLRDDGVILLDDSEFIQYQACIWDMEQKGFKVLYFFGMRPVTDHFSCTSIFYRPKNCLGI